MSDLSTLTGEWVMLNPSYSAECKFDGDVYPNIVMAVEASKFPKGRRIPFIAGGSLAANYGFAEPYTDKQLEVLEELLRRRFSEGSVFYAKLLETGDEELVYENKVHRNWYGSCTCARCMNVEGQNHVGKILVRIREGK